MPTALDIVAEPPVVTDNVPACVAKVTLPVPDVRKTVEPVNVPAVCEIAPSSSVVNVTELVPVALAPKVMLPSLPADVVIVRLVALTTPVVVTPPLAVTDSEPPADDAVKIVSVALLIVILPLPPVLAVIVPVFVDRFMLPVPDASVRPGAVRVPAV